MRWRFIPVFDHFLDARGRDDEKALSSWWKTHRHPFFLACPQARLVGLRRALAFRRFAARSEVKENRLTRRSFRQGASRGSRRPP
jgi:hypothetical protein